MKCLDYSKSLEKLESAVQTAQTNPDPCPEIVVKTQSISTTDFQISETKPWASRPALMNQTKPNRENKVHDLKTQTYASDTYTIHHSDFDTK